MAENVTENPTNGAGASAEGNQQNATQGSGAGSTKETTQSTTIDWSKIDVSQIPVDVIKKAPAYKEVLDESVARRQKIAELKQHLDDDDKPAKPEGKITDSKTNDDDPMLARLSKLEQLLTGLVTEKVEGSKAAIGAKYGLSAEQSKLVNGNTPEDIEASAKGIATMFGIKPPASDASSTNPAGATEDGLVARLKARMSGSDTMSNPFDPGVQRMTGGGIRE